MFKKLIELKYPIAALDAAISWECSVSLAKQRLRTGVEDDLLVMAENSRGKRLYSPTLYMVSMMTNYV